MLGLWPVDVVGVPTHDQRSLGTLAEVEHLAVRCEPPDGEQGTRIGFTLTLAGENGERITLRDSVSLRGNR